MLMVYVSSVCSPMFSVGFLRFVLAHANNVWPVWYLHSLDGFVVLKT
jgi:hypothetical protein